MRFKVISVTAAQCLYLFVGGGTGATCRYAVSLAMRARYRGGFPVGTFVVNITGCFALGVAASLLTDRPDNSMWSVLITTGFLGGYTTFSTYALEGVLLLLERKPLTSALTAIGSVTVGLLAAAFGASLAHLV